MASLRLTSSCSLKLQRARSYRSSGARVSPMRGNRFGPSRPSHDRGKTTPRARLAGSRGAARSHPRRTHTWCAYRYRRRIRLLREARSRTSSRRAGSRRPESTSTSAPGPRSSAHRARSQIVHGGEDRFYVNGRRNHVGHLRHVGNARETLAFAPGFPSAFRDLDQPVVGATNQPLLSRLIRPAKWASRTDP